MKLLSTRGLSAGKAGSLIAAFLVGVLAVFVLRFALIKSDHTHYHANFVLFVNGVQDKFDNFTFYEEVATCSADMQSDPKHRAHMHNLTPHVIHVHSDGVTWGHFFANLGYGLSNKALTTDDSVFVDDASGKKLTFWLNSQQVGTIANTLIKSGDALLINYGTEDETTIGQRITGMPKDAHDYNTRQDPASCAGAEELDFTARLKRAIDLTN